MSDTSDGLTVGSSKGRRTKITVYLIDDFVRLAPEPYIRAVLSEADIVSLSENCRSSYDVLEHTGQWIEGATARDIIHTSCSLHDIRRNQGYNGPVAGIGAYRSNLIQIFNCLKQTGAKIIWASSTPFLESVHNIVKPSRRYLANLEAYSRVAEDLARQYDFTVNGLYSLMLKQGSTDVILCNGLHFNEFGGRVMGKAVAEAISKQMGQLDVIHFYHVFNIETDFKLQSNISWNIVATLINIKLRRNR